MVKIILMEQFKTRRTHTHNINNNNNNNNNIRLTLGFITIIVIDT
jgi:hypothetical protein